MAPGLEPGSQSGALLGPRVGTGDVGDEKPAHGQPLLKVGKIIGEGCWNLPLVQQREKPKACIVVVVTGAGAGWKATGNDVCAVVDNIGHVVPRTRSLWDASQESAAASITPPASLFHPEMGTADTEEGQNVPQLPKRGDAREPSSVAGDASCAVVAMCAHLFVAAVQAIMSLKNAVDWVASAT
jgi:hypothetical protein